jgi:hypothetical protein
LPSKHTLSLTPNLPPASWYTNPQTLAFTSLLQIPLSHKIHHLLPDRFLIDDPFPRHLDLPQRFRLDAFPPASWYTNPQTLAFTSLLQIENRINPIPEGYLEVAESMSPRERAAHSRIWIMPFRSHSSCVGAVLKN